MSTKELWNSIAMQPIDDLHLIIEKSDILSPFILRNLYVDISLRDELALMLKLVQLAMNTIQQYLEDYCANYRNHDYKDYDWDYQSV